MASNLNKLTEAEKTVVAYALLGGASGRQLAERFNISYQRVYYMYKQRIGHGRLLKHKRKDLGLN